MRRHCLDREDDTAPGKPQPRQQKGLAFHRAIRRQAGTVAPDVNADQQEARDCVRRGSGGAKHDDVSGRAADRPCEAKAGLGSAVRGLG
jgi:hypothetical protein